MKTVELKKEHRALLRAIAARRGWRSYSRVIQEAIEFYLHHHAEAEEARRALLRRRGTWSPKEVEHTRAAIAELRERWTTLTTSL
jgi:Arc/MetJ-type ribon-helix-helix transcriptional regulator